jgi:DNA-binding response OmpR family regulator
MRRILIVEDDAVIANLCKMHLLKKGHDVAVEHDGGYALQCMDKFIPHMVILDIILPNKNGFDILQEIKSHKKHKGTDVIVYTSLSQPEDRKKFTELGASAYYSKNQTGIHELVERVDAHIMRLGK